MPACRPVVKLTFLAESEYAGTGCKMRDEFQKRRRPAIAGLLAKRMKGLEPSTFCMASWC